MSTQQDIYAAGSKSHPPMLNKENYVPLSSRLLCYAKIRPNGKLIHNSIINGPYVRRMIPKPEADDQAIQTILLGLPKDIYAVVDSYETAQEIWLRKEVDELKAKRLVKIQDPLALMANSNNPYAFPAPHQDQPSFNQNYIQQPMPNHEDITDLTTTMNMAVTLMAKAFKLNYSTPTNNNQRISSNPRNRKYAGQNVGNLNGYKAVHNVKNQVSQNPRVQNVGNQNGLIGVPKNANLNGNGNLVAARAKGNAAGHNGNQIRCYNCRGVGHFARNCTQASTSGTQTDKAPVYDSDGSAEYTELLEPILDQHQVPHNDNNVISENLAIEVEKVNSINRKLKESNADLTKTLQLAQESREKMKQLNKEIKPTNYTKINHLSRVFVSQTAKSREELYFSNDSKTVNVSKSISIPNEEFFDDTTPSVARKFLNEVKSTIVTLQRVVKHKMTLKTHNWSSSAHQELHKIVKDKNFPIVNQVDDREQNFEIQFLKEAAKFVEDFKSLAKEPDESLAKHKTLELEIKRLLRAVVSQDIMSVVQNNFVVDTSNLQTDLERMKERFENCIIKKENEYAKLWNDWYKKCKECKYDKISYDKAYKDMQQKIERLQAQLGDLKGKSKDTSYVSNTLNPLSQKLESENVELEFQVLNCNTLKSVVRNRILNIRGRYFTVQ
nr:hypothetical protein [Tanacetum cinerariifolium]